MRRIILCLLLVPTVLAAAERRPAPPGPEFSEEWVLVRLERPLTKVADGGFSLETPFVAVNALIEERGISKIEHALPVSTRHPRSPNELSRHGLDRVYRLRVPAGTDVPGLVEELSVRPGVAWAGLDSMRRPGAIIIPNDPRFSDQWGLHNTGQTGGTVDADVDAPEAWEIETGAGVLVAVIDTGVDMDHEDLAGNLVAGCGLADGPCWDFIEDDPVPEDYPGGSFSGHGTNTASMIAALTDNGVGISGICWSCEVMPLRIWNENGGGGTISRIADAIIWATDHGARVINFSGGSHNPPDPIELGAIAYAADAGVIFVSITGNNGSTPVWYPARYAEAVSVGGTNKFDETMGNSNYGAEIDVVAPGANILSADLDNNYLYWSGTSYAGPFVSGLSGLILSMNPSIGREEARHLVQSGAEDQVGDPSEDTPGFDEYHGYGRINMERTLAATASSASLQVEGKQSTRLFLEAPNAVADSYDFVRGNLSTLSESQMGVGLGSLLCLEDDSTDPDTAGGSEDEGVPAPGLGYFYLARFNSAAGVGSYGGSSTNRDRFATTWDWVTEGDQQDGRFGFSVDSAGDVNNDGYGDVIVGSYLYDGELVDEGAAFVYHGSSDGLGAAPVWSAKGGQASAWLGTTVAAAGDVNGDGYGDVIVGAQNYTNGESNEGRAYVYLGSALGLESAPAWVVEGEQAFAQLGFRVATAGDVDDDGYDEVIVAARRYDNGQNNEGRAYLYRGSAAGLSATPDWTFETNQVEAQVTAVATAGDVNCDGYDDVLVASRKYDNPEANEGRVFVFYGADTGLSSLPSATLEIDVPGAEFGFSASTAGNVDGAGCDDVIIGAHLYTNGENAEGAAFVFLGSLFGLSTTPAWSFESDEAEARAGQSARNAGDVNGDSYDDIIVGGGASDLLKSYHNDSRTDEGKVWLFLGSDAGPSREPVWWEVGRQTSASFGWAAAPAGDVNGDTFDDIIVGAYRYDDAQGDEGRAYLFPGPVISSDCGTSP